MDRMSQGARAPETTIASATDDRKEAGVVVERCEKVSIAGPELAPDPKAVKCGALQRGGRPRTSDVGRGAREGIDAPRVGP